MKENEQIEVTSEWVRMAKVEVSIDANNLLHYDETLDSALVLSVMSNQQNVDPGVTKEFVRRLRQKNQLEIAMICVGDSISFNNKTWQVTNKLLAEEAKKECPEHSVTKVMEEQGFSLLVLECDTPKHLI